MEGTRFILYVHPLCSNSASIVDLMNESIPRGVIGLQSFDELTEPPVWLNGTPILVDRSNGTVYRGRDAFTAIAQISIDIREQQQKQYQQTEQRQHWEQQQPQPQAQAQPQPQAQAQPQPQPQLPPQSRPQSILKKKTQRQPGGGPPSSQANRVKLSTAGWGNGNTPKITYD